MHRQHALARMRATAPSYSAALTPPAPFAETRSAPTFWPAHSITVLQSRSSAAASERV